MYLCLTTLNVVVRQGRLPVGHIGWMNEGEEQWGGGGDEKKNRHAARVECSCYEIRVV